MRSETSDWLDDFRPEGMARFEVGPTKATWIALGATGFLAALGLGLAWSIRRRGGGALDVVPHFELGRYLGTWYEVARYPNPMEVACTSVTAHFSLRTDGSLVVVQRCRKNSHILSARGLATADPEQPAKLNIRFLGSMGAYAGRYWVIQLGPQYEYAVVSEPERRHLWVLSRTPTLADEVYRQILTRLQAQGFEIRRLVSTPQAQRV